MLHSVTSPQPTLRVRYIDISLGTWFFDEPIHTFQNGTETTRKIISKIFLHRNFQLPYKLENVSLI